MKDKEIIVVEFLGYCCVQILHGEVKRLVIKITEYLFELNPCFYKPFGKMYPEFLFLYL